MVAILFGAFFTASAVLAIGVIAGSWQRYAGAMRAIPQELAAVTDLREVRVRIREVRVVPTATVLRPDFTARQPRRVQDALPAAA